MTPSHQHDSTRCDKQGGGIHDPREHEKRVELPRIEGVKGRSLANRGVAERHRNTEIEAADHYESPAMTVDQVDERNTHKPEKGNSYGMADYEILQRTEFPEQLWEDLTSIRTSSLKRNGKGNADKDERGENGNA